MDVATHERQDHAAGVANVLGRVHQALGQPDEHDERLKPLAAPPEVAHEQRRKNQLTQGPPQEVEGLPEQAEQNVASLVQEEIDAIQEVIVIADNEPANVGKQCPQEYPARFHGWTQEQE